jgi:methyl-accepting chemotaxis protein
MRLPRLSLKWKIFVWCFGLATALLIAAFLNSQHMVKQTAGRSHLELQGFYHGYRSFQHSMAQGMSAAAAVWAQSPQLRAAFAKGEIEVARPVLVQVDQSLTQTLHPDFVVAVDRHGDVFVPPEAPIDVAGARTMRMLADLRAGMPISDALLEYRQRAFLVCGEPVTRDGEVVGAILLGTRLERVFAQFKAQTDDDPAKQVQLALVHNQTTTAASAHSDDWDDLARATRPEAREAIDEGVSGIRLADGLHDFFAAQLNGYDGATQGSIGTLYLLRNRVEHEARLRSLLHDTLLLSTVALLLSALFSYGISLVVTRPLRKFIDGTEDLAHGHGDLTRRLDPGTNASEMHQLADNLNLMLGNLQKLASEVQGASFHVGASSAEISAASKQMLSGAKDQAARIESSTAAVTELSSSIQTVAENAMQATKATKEAADQAQESFANMSRFRDTFVETAGKIEELGESGKRIGKIVEVIQQISEQTSLLALNASIEAAHAGEHGRGFAVVADEVSSLARRVGQSAKDIEGLIAAISEQTQEAVSSMQAGTREVEVGAHGVQNTMTALKQIAEVVQDTARSVQEQALVSDEIARNMDAVQKIAQEVLGSSEEAVTQGEQLHGLALKLEELVRGFNIDAASEGSDGRVLAKAPSTPALPDRARERRKTARG